MTDRQHRHIRLHVCILLRLRTSSLRTGTNWGGSLGGTIMKHAKSCTSYTISDSRSLQL